MLGISEGRPHCRTSRRTSQTSSNRLIRAVLGSLSGRRSCDLLVSRFLASKKKGAHNARACRASDTKEGGNF